MSRQTFTICDLCKVHLRGEYDRPVVMIVGEMKSISFDFLCAECSEKIKDSVCKIAAERAGSWHNSIRENDEVLPKSL